MVLINLLFFRNILHVLYNIYSNWDEMARGIKPCNSAVSGHIVASCYKIYKFLNTLPTKINQTEDSNKQQ